MFINPLVAYVACQCFRSSLAIVTLGPSNTLLQLACVGYKVAHEQMVYFTGHCRCIGPIQHSLKSMALFPFILMGLELDPIMQSVFPQRTDIRKSLLYIIYLNKGTVTRIRGRSTDVGS